VGLTAAAAFRWLNGGDFQIFPPAVQGESTHEESFEPIVRQEERNSTNTQEQQNRFSDDCNLNDSITEGVPTTKEQSLSEQVQSLVEALHLQTEQQGKMLKKLSNKSDSRITDESMNLLRTNDDAAAVQHSSMSILKLVEIQAELSYLRRDMACLRNSEATTLDTEGWESQLDRTLKKLHSCLDHLGLKQPVATNMNGNRRSWDVCISSPATSDAGDYIDGKDDKEELVVPEDDQARNGQPETRGQRTLAYSIRRLIEENDIPALQNGSRLLYLYVVNVSNNPRVPRYRKIFTSNESFQKVDNLAGARDLLYAVGFVEQGDFLEWGASDTTKEKFDEEELLMRLKKATAALNILKSPFSSSKEELMDTVLTNLSLTGTPTAGVGTPQRKLNDEMNQSELSTMNLPTTPECGSIISPPVTKKHLLNLDPNSPSVHEPATLEGSANGSSTGCNTIGK